MAKTFTVPALKNSAEPFRIRVAEGETLPFAFDFAPWCEDSGDTTLTTATWTLKSGTATISNKALANNRATANIAFSQSGRVLIELDVTDGTLTKTAHLEALVIDPEVQSDDYGLCGG